LRLRAPELTGRGWLNTDGRSLSLAALRGRFVLLDFWTFACVNCLHVIEELRPLEERFADVLVTIGVHSPKFEHESDPRAVRDAVERYRLRHPVLDDPQLRSWDAYAAKAWPTLVLIDPTGYIVTEAAGERHAPELTALIERLIPVHEADGSLRRGTDLPAGSAELTPLLQPPSTSVSADVFADSVRLRFPGGLLPLPADRYPTTAGPALLVSDTADHQLVILTGDGTVEQARIGSGERGLLDGDSGTCCFADPLGAALLPADVAARIGYDVVLADSGNSALRGLSLADLSVRTLSSGNISTPWDVAWFAGSVVVAGAGTHQLWSFDPDRAVAAVLAGTAREGLVDGAAARSWFAQPSGLAVDPADSADSASDASGVLWVADAETSALRMLWFADGSLQVSTAIGQGLFEFGQVDGDATVARLQHPLAVAVLPDGSVAIADTYNGAIRRYDPTTGQTSTLKTGLSEPSALAVINPADVVGAGVAVPWLVVAESTAHRLTRVPIPAQALTGRRSARPLRLPVTDLNPGRLQLDISFAPPTGQKLDTDCGDPTRLSVTADPPELLVNGDGPGVGLTRSLVLDDRVSGGRVEGSLLIDVRASACDLVADVGAACYLYRQQWEVPIRLVPGSPSQLSLDLPS
jgi:thiol-disulfide isomerase/thioredoxin